MTRLAACFLFLLTGCAAGGPSAPAAPVTDCGATHERVGWIGALETRQHRVQGLVEIVDDCTIEVTGFGFDGAGLDVRFVVADNPDFTDHVVLTDDLRRTGGYDDETLTLPLTTEVDLDAVSHASIWCVPAGVDFGSAELGPSS